MYTSFVSQEPKTLQEAVLYFSDTENCIEYVASRRWPDGPTCPVCGSTSVTFLPSVSRFQCSKRHPKRQFTVKTGTVFEDSPLPLSKWLIATWLVANCKNGVSSYELHRAIGVTQKTAWFMNHRIRLAMQNGTFEKLGGEVEADETYIGGKARNMHWAKRKARGPMGGGMGKEIVLGMLERGGKVVTVHVPKNDRKTLSSNVIETVDETAKLFTDAHSGYDHLNFYYQRQVIDHAVSYVRGNVHTNSLESYWSLLKRTIGGTYISVEPFHLFRYLDEQAFRYNERKRTDTERFSLALNGVSGKRLTYDALTGKDGGQQA
jgi:hypothetical protein